MTSNYQDIIYHYIDFNIYNMSSHVSYASNTMYYNDSLYSYNYLICKIIYNPITEKYDCYINKTFMSNTTSKHVNFLIKTLQQHSICNIIYTTDSIKPNCLKEHLFCTLFDKEMNTSNNNTDNSDKFEYLCKMYKRFIK